MQVFNVGVLEVLTILVLAFILLGPKRTIQSARRIGKWFRNLVKSPIWREIVTTSRELRNLPKKVMDDTELSKLIQELDLSTQEVKEILSQTQLETEEQLLSLEADIDEEYKISSDLSR